MPSDAGSPSFDNCIFHKAMTRKNKLSHRDVFCFLIFINLFMADLIRTFTPPYVTIILSIACTCYIIKYCLIDKISRYLAFVFVFFVFANIVSFYSLMGNCNLGYFYLFLIMLLGCLLRNDIDRFKPYIKIFLVINLFFLIREKITGDFLIPYTEDISIYRAYGQGVFTYTKNAADALSLCCILFRKEKHWMVIIIISLAMVGVRGGIIFACAVFAFDLSINFPYKKFAHNLLIYFKLEIKAINSIIALLASVLFFVFLINKFPGFFCLGRLQSLLNLESPTYVFRSEMLTAHFNCFASFNPINMLLGGGEYCPSVIGNGAENLYLQMLPQHGLIFFIFFVSLLIMACVTTLKEFKYYYPILLFILEAWFVRYGLTWMGGIIIWSFIFSAITYSHKASSKVRSGEQL